MSAHTLTIRPLPDSTGDGWAKTSDLEVLLDGKVLDGVQRIVIAPLDAWGGLIQVELHMVVNPDFTLPADVTSGLVDVELAERLDTQADVADPHPIAGILREAAARLRGAAVNA